MAPEAVLQIGGTGAAGHVYVPAPGIIILQRVDIQVHQGDRLTAVSVGIVIGKVADIRIQTVITQVELQIGKRYGHVRHDLAGDRAVALHIPVVFADGDIHGAGHVGIVDILHEADVFLGVQVRHGRKRRNNAREAEKQG